MDRYSNEAARAAGPDIDDDVPEAAIRKIAQLTKLALDLYQVARLFQTSPAMAAMPAELERRACDILDLDPPGFDPSTEGP